MRGEDVGDLGLTGLPVRTVPRRWSHATPIDAAAPEVAVPNYPVGIPGEGGDSLAADGTGHAEREVIVCPRRDLASHIPLPSNSSGSRRRSCACWRYLRVDMQSAQRAALRKRHRGTTTGRVWWRKGGDRCAHMS